MPPGPRAHQHRSEVRSGSGGGEDRSRHVVLHLIKSLSVVGGAEQLLLSVTAAGNRDRFDYHVAHVLSEPSPYLLTKLQEAGVSVHDLGAPSHFDLRWMRRLRHLLREAHVELVHVHLPYGASLGRLVSYTICPRPAIVHTQHNIWHENTPVVRATHFLTYLLDDADIAVSRAVWSALPKPFRRRTEILVHGVYVEGAELEEEARDDLRASFGLQGGELLVSTVANMRKEKGYEVLLASARQLFDEGLPVRFVAVGAGPLEEEVRKRRDELGMADRFRLTGFRGDAKAVVAASDMFVLASHHEGFPIAVMEALYLGVPVVSTAVGDVPLAVADGTSGLVVEPGNSEALARAIRTLALHPDLRARMAEAALEAGSRFDVGRAVDRIEEIYESVLRHRVSLLKEGRCRATARTSRRPRAGR